MSYLLSVVIPCRNEALNIREIVTKLGYAAMRRQEAWQIICVDDHCEDNTAATAAEFSADVVRNEREPGYGNAVRAGLEEANGAWVTVMVADGSDSVEDLELMLDAAQNSGVQAVFGSRFVAGATIHDYPRIKYVANRLGNRFIGWWLNANYGDFTNPFKLFKWEIVHDVLPQCRATDFSLGMELAVLTWQRAHENIVITQTHWKNREQGQSKFKIKHALGYLRTLYRLLPTEQREGYESMFGLFIIFLAVVAAIIFSR